MNKQARKELRRRLMEQRKALSITATDINSARIWINTEDLSRLLRSFENVRSAAVKLLEFGIMCGCEADEECGWCRLAADLDKEINVADGRESCEQKTFHIDRRRDTAVENRV